MPTARNYEAAVRAASIVEKIRGYGHVKARNFNSVDEEWTKAVAQLSNLSVIELKQVA